MKATLKFASVVALLLSAAACSNGEDVKKTASQPSVKRSNPAPAQGYRHSTHEEDTAPQLAKSSDQKKELELAEFCKGVERSPGEYSEEDKIRCDKSIPH